MLGYKRPVSWTFFERRFAGLQIWLVASRPYWLKWSLIAVLCISVFQSRVSNSNGAEKTVRIRLAWGNGAVAKQLWTGNISIDGAELSDLQPLGLEVDAPVANRIESNQLIVSPLVARSFDGCDVTVRADEHALVRIELRNGQATQPQVFETTLSKVIESQFQLALDELGGYFLARRTPGDRLRVLSARDHLVFNPGETWKLKLKPDVAAELSNGPVLIDVRLRPTGSDKPTWQASQQVIQASQLTEGLGFEVPCPIEEGAYRLTFTARHQEGFATRFVPGQQSRSLASREVEFVVIDPNAKLPVLVDQWLPVLTIDPANPTWWQRMPSWAHVPRIRERATGSYGNVRPVVRPIPTGKLVELPPVITDRDPYWQSYTLPVREPGQPHLVEIEYPLGVEQRLSISLVEPDAAGRVTSAEQDASLSCEGRSTAADGEVGVHRFVVWPRTRSPQLLIVNSHTSEPAQYGKIRLLQQDGALAALTEAKPADDGEQLVAAYLDKPTLAAILGASETLDSTSGLSIQSWSTFLQGAQRLAQALRFNGYNGLVLSASADGSALYPSQLLKPSPRYDTGLLAANGQDPQQKDVLEMLFRVFDREGLRVVPTLGLAAPLPELEVLRQANELAASGIGCVDHMGSTETRVHAESALAPLYNPLNNRVQTELAGVVDELLSRYAHHRSFSGIGVQLSGQGYGMLPGLAWGFDDSTVAEFSSTTGIRLPDNGNDRFRRRAELLIGQYAERWTTWRQSKLTAFYAQLGTRVAEARSDTGLIVLTDQLFSSNQLRQRLRGAMAESTPLPKILGEHGVDLQAIDNQPSVAVLAPFNLVNDKATQGWSSPSLGGTSSGLLTSHATTSFRLPSFDDRSPFGVEQTFLTVQSSKNAPSATARRPLVAALISQSPPIIVDGGASLAIVGDRASCDALTTIRKLSVAGPAVRTQRSQPVTLRVLRTGEATMVNLINEAPWPVQASLNMSTLGSCQWNRLGLEQGMETSQLTGTLAAGDQVWRVALQPYGIQAWKFCDDRLRLGDLQVEVSDLAQVDLQQRIDEIEARASNLNIERPYSLLQNPGFELQGEESPLVGWQPRQGASGEISLDDTAPHFGARALRLQSLDELGVAVQSQLFAAPETGQLTVSFFLRTVQVANNAQLSIAVQDQFGGRDYQRVASLSSDQLGDSAWVRQEFSLHDVPVGVDTQLRLLFHVTGTAELQIDDVALCDLRFDEARRRSLVKRIHGANLALEQGQVVDCLRVVDDYWSKFLVEHVPPAKPLESIAAKPTVSTSTPPEPKQDQGTGSRLRGWVPKIWR